MACARPLRDLVANLCEERIEILHKGTRASDERPPHKGKDAYLKGEIAGSCGPKSNSIQSSLSSSPPFTVRMSVGNWPIFK